MLCPPSLDAAEGIAYMYGRRAAGRLGGRILLPAGYNTPSRSKCSIARAMPSSSTDDVI